MITTSFRFVVRLVKWLLSGACAGLTISQGLQAHNAKQWMDGEKKKMLNKNNIEFPLCTKYDAFPLLISLIKWIHKNAGKPTKWATSVEPKKKKNDV